jgi:hypothetical protein
LPPHRKTPYVSANLTVEARDALQRLTLTVSAEAGRRIGMSAVLLAALAVATAHKDQLTELLNAPHTEEGDTE